MKKSYKIILNVLVFMVSFFIFNLLEFEPLNQMGNTYFQSLVFSTVLLISIFKPSLRIKLFYIAFLVLLVSVGTYMLQKLTLANAFSSVSIGMLFIIALSYLPEIIKKGCVEKF